MYPVGDGRGKEDLCHICSGGRSVADVPSRGWGGEEDLCHVRSGDTQWLMYPVGDGGGEEDLMPWGTLTTYVPSGRGKEDLCLRSGGCSVTHVPSGGWERKGGSLPYMQWGTLSG